jgi:hypothetical protein
MIYSLITHEKIRRIHPALTPTFLGQVAENKRPIDFLMEHFDKGKAPTKLRT